MHYFASVTRRKIWNFSEAVTINMLRNDRNMSVAPGASKFQGGDFSAGSLSTKIVGCNGLDVSGVQFLEPESYSEEFCEGSSFNRYL